MESVQNKTKERLISKGKPRVCYRIKEKWIWEDPKQVSTTGRNTLPPSPLPSPTCLILALETFPLLDKEIVIKKKSSDLPQPHSWLMAGREPWSLNLQPCPPRLFKGSNSRDHSELNRKWFTKCEPYHFTQVS